MRSIAWLIARLLLAAAARADPPVIQKAGEWLITEAPGKDGKVGPPIKRCFRQKLLFETIEKMKNCTKKEIRTVGNVMTADAVCTTAHSTVTFHGTVVAGGENSFHSEAHADYSPPIGNISEIGHVTDLRWLGPCPAGEQPVD